MRQHEIKSTAASECAGGVRPPQTCIARSVHADPPSITAGAQRIAGPSRGFAGRPRSVHGVAVPSLTRASVRAQDKWGCSFRGRLISKSMARNRECPWQVRTDRSEAAASPAVCVCVWSELFINANEEEVGAFTLDWIELVQNHFNGDLTSLACSRCCLTNSSTSCTSSQKADNAFPLLCVWMHHCGYVWQN